MADSVENRVVSISFDNKAFQANMQATIASLDKLRTSIDLASSKKGLENLNTTDMSKLHKSLDFSKSKQGIQDLNNSVKGFNMGPISTSIEHVSAGFLTLATIGVTALSRITNSAISAGVNFARGFSFQPVMDGFHEFETNMNSIQTILANTASKGTTLNEVNDALNELNIYSDKTIYNFTEMARNIGTFTAVGIALKPATSAIKGIANLAAVSGSSADQASTAMYQLSQAMASGSVKLMDWNSVVNAGMGGEVFQKSLFETGKALKTLKGVPMGQTFDQWKKAGNTFRDSLKDGWVTSDVLTTTLRGFTGEATKAELKAKGFNDKQIVEIQKMGKIATGAATQVKTFTQLISTVKEAIGSGWTQSFQLIFGNFDEAKKLFTGINNVIGKFVGDQAGARNKMLKTWHDFGARNAAIEGLKNVFKALGQIMNTVREAFRSIFPPMTGEKLIRLTASFVAWSKGLKMGEETLNKLKSTFRGFFAGLSIGWTIIKETFKLFGAIWSALFPARSALLGVTATWGDFMTKLQQSLVKGGKIHEFFQKLTQAIIAPIKYIQNLAKTIGDFFSKATTGPNRVTSRFDAIGKAFDQTQSAMDRFHARMQGVYDFLNKLGDSIKGWFSELGHRIADAFQPGDFDAVLDIINVGLLGGIVLLLRKFLKGGLKIDIGGGLVDKIKGAFDQLTGTLKAMQTQLKSKALMNIAIAVGVLTLSLIALSMIDSKALTKALAAITVSFAELIGAMTAIDKLKFSGGSVAKLGGVATSMILLSTAMLIFSAAVKVFSTMDSGELAKGLAGISAGLAALIAASKLLQGNSGGLITAAFAMTGMATALILLAGAVKAFGMMDWGTIGKGLTAVAAGLGILVLAMKAMPKSSVISGLGFIEVAIGLNILAGAVKLFGMMSMEELGKGLIGVAGGLIAVAAAMHLMPLSLPITGAGLILVAVGMNILAGAMKIIGSMDTETLAKGIGGIGAALLVLALGTNAMNGAIPGAIALGIVSGALLILSKVLQNLAVLSIAQIVTGLVAIGGAMAGIALLSNALSATVPAMLAFGVALGIIGGAIALFGVGVMFIAKAFEILAKSGEAGAKAFVGMVATIVTASTQIGKAAAMAFLSFVEEILKAMPLLIRLFQAFLEQLLVTIIREVPLIAKALSVIITNWLALVRKQAPDIIKTGFFVLVQFLKGVRDNIYQITTLAAEIIVGFITALTKKIPDLVTAAVKFIVAFVNAIASHMGEIVAAGANMIIQFLNGIAQNLGGIVGAVFNIITTFITELGKGAGRIAEAGGKALGSLIDGMTKAVNTVGDKIKELVKAVADQIGSNGSEFIKQGGAALRKILQAMIDEVPKLLGPKGKFVELMTTIANALGKSVQPLVEGFIQMIIDMLNGAATAMRNKRKDLWDAIGNFASAFLSLITNGLSDKIGTLKDWFFSLPGKIVKWIQEGPFGSALDVLFGVGSAMAIGLWNGIESMKDWLKEKVGGLASDVKDWMGIGWKIVGDPYSKVFMRVGGALVTGLSMGMDNNSHLAKKSAALLSKEVTDAAVPNLSAIKTALSKINDLSDLKEFNPTITPVLDLTKVKSQANTMDKYFQIAQIKPDVSIANANVIAKQQALAKIKAETEPTEPITKILTFEQNNYAPKALSTADIYRNTKSQIALAKEELGV